MSGVQYLLTASEMRETDRRTIESFGIPGRVLMENAGRGATRFFLKVFGDLSQKKVGIIAGKGNNGGDGFVVARYLSQKNIDVTVFLLARKDSVKSGDAGDNLALLYHLNVPVIEIPDEASFAEHHPALCQQDIWVDAIFGTGLNSDITGYFRTIIEYINSLNKPVFAIDIPSGINSDTGQPCGVCIRAVATATFAYPKIGHYLYPGAAYRGKLDITDIGIPKYIADEVCPKQYLINPEMLGLPYRSADAHKGDTGHVLVIAGSKGKSGAAAMTAMSAMRAGAGLVTLGVPESINTILETLAVEVMTEPLPDAGGILSEAAFDKIIMLAKGKRVMAIGPGLGQFAQTQQLIRRMIWESHTPMVIDADGLNALSGHTEMLKQLRVPVILTPHPGEMARLVNITTSEVQQDRITCARQFAKTYRVYLVLKGAGTVVAIPDGRVFVNPSGNSGMASGGMGDVLTGIITGLLAQGISPEIAACAGVYLHGAAADVLAETTGAYGFLASEVMAEIPHRIAFLRERSSDF